MTQVRDSTAEEATLLQVDGKPGLLKAIEDSLQSRLDLRNRAPVDDDIIKVRQTRGRCQAFQNDVEQSRETARCTSSTVVASHIPVQSPWETDGGLIAVLLSHTHLVIPGV